MSREPYMIAEVDTPQPFREQIIYEYYYYFLRSYS